MFGKDEEALVFLMKLSYEGGRDWYSMKERRDKRTKEAYKEAMEHTAKKGYRAQCTSWSYNKLRSNGGTTFKQYPTTIMYQLVRSLKCPLRRTSLLVAKEDCRDWPPFDRQQV